VASVWTHGQIAAIVGCPEPNVWVGSLPRRTDGATKAPFQARIGHVVGVSAERQVAESQQRNISYQIDALIIVPDAQADIAGVDDEEPFRYRLARSERPRRAVGELRVILAPTEASVTTLTTSSLRLRCASPQPTGGRFVNPLEEAIFHRADIGVSDAAVATELGPAVIEGQEVEPTLGTNSRYGTLLRHRDLLSRGRGVAPGLLAQIQGRFVARIIHHD
jgi:hypothetical protein